MPCNGNEKCDMLIKNKGKNGFYEMDTTLSNNYST